MLHSFVSIFLSYTKHISFPTTTSNFTAILVFWKKKPQKTNDQPLWVYSWFFHNRLFQHILKKMSPSLVSQDLSLSYLLFHIAVHVLFCIPPSVPYLVCTWQHEKYTVQVRDIFFKSIWNHSCWTKFFHMHCRERPVLFTELTKSVRRWIAMT